MRFILKTTWFGLADSIMETESRSDLADGLNHWISRHPEPDTLHLVVNFAEPVLEHGFTYYPPSKSELFRTYDQFYDEVWSLH